MKYPYANHYTPSFPMIQIRFFNPEEGLSTESVGALLDTGSDGSLIPIAYLRHILAPALRDMRIKSHWGEWRSVQLFSIDIELANMRLPGVFVVGDDYGDEIILGRNLLNKLHLSLDGPAALTEVLGISK